MGETDAVPARGESGLDRKTFVTTHAAGSRERLADSAQAPYSHETEEVTR
jgi:hypothetical protein